MLKVTVLGCGPSLGVPVIGCNCHVCTSSLSYNKRTRSAILVEDNGTQILIDFGFEIREQLIKAKVDRLDGAILTHDHADHISGIDNLRIFAHLHKRPLNIYTDFATSQIMQDRYKYLFENNKLLARPIDFFDEIIIGNMTVKFFKQCHGTINSLGIRIKDLVYSVDVVDFPEQSEEFLRDIKLWILDCSSYRSNDRHAGLDKVLEWREKYKPEKIFLTNMSHAIDYYDIVKKLPHNIFPLYDGYEINL